MEQSEMRQEAAILERASFTEPGEGIRIRVPKIVNFVFFQICWFACVLGAVWGFSALGPIFALAIGGLAVLSARNRANEIIFLLAATVCGTLFDLIPLELGAFAFVQETAVPWGYPLWMSSLWLGFATTFRSSLSWLSGRYLLAGFFGFVGGPLAYIAGEKLGAIAIGSNTVFSLLVIGIFWALITPVLFLISEKFE